MDRVSLVIASHRRGAKIGPTLASALDQTRPPDEILVLNDGGFAETREYIASTFPTVRVVDAVGGSPAAARNLGAQHASQPLVMFLDDDDVLHRHAVATLLVTLRTFPEARAAYADHTFTDLVTGQHVPNHHVAVPAFHRLANVPPARTSQGVRLFDRRLYYPMLRAGLLQQPWIVDRGVFLSHGGFDVAFPCNEDWELYLRIVRDTPVALTDRVISDHIVEDGRAHTSRSARLDEAGEAIVRKHLRLAFRSLDARAVLILLRRLQNFYKTAGDRIADVDLRAAWRAYLRALRTWPFDPVVVVRALVLWPVRLLSGASGDRG